MREEEPYILPVLLNVLKWQGVMQFNKLRIDTCNQIKRKACLNNRTRPDEINLFEQTAYVQRNKEACSYKNCFRGEAVSITYSECAFVALGIQHATCCHLWPSQFYIFFHNIS